VGSCLRLIDFVYHSTLGLRVIKKKKKTTGWNAVTVRLRYLQFGESGYELCPELMFTEMCSGSEEGSCIRLIDFCITQL